MVDAEEARRIMACIESMLGALDDLSPFAQLLTAEEAGHLRDLLQYSLEYVPAAGGKGEAEALGRAHRRLTGLLLGAVLDGEWGGGKPDLRGVLLQRLFDSAHPYLDHCEAHGPEQVPGPLRRLISRDLSNAQILAQSPWGIFLPDEDRGDDGPDGFLPGVGQEPAAVAHLRDRFLASADWSELAGELGAFVHECGRGSLRRMKAFRLLGSATGSSLAPIRHFADFPLDWLEGHRERIETLEENTLHFLAGHRAHNVLIWGPRGGGKSTLVRAIVGKYADRGLRAVEITPENYRHLPDLFALIRGRRQRFIGVLDNISLDRGDQSLHLLSRILDGGLEEWPDNLVFYATSNYKDLVDREGERPKGLGQMQMDDQRPNLVNQSIQPQFYDPQQLQRLDEERALDDRFALKIYLDLPRKNHYQSMVLSYARRAGLDVPEADLLADFEAWRMRHNHDLVGGRTARDFILSYKPSTDPLGEG